jgi:hypothetical protein
MDGARKAARSNAWRKVHHTCACEREVYGNGKSHERSCEVSLRERGWPLDAGLCSAIREHVWEQQRNLAGLPQLIRAVEQRLGALYLARRAVGDKTELGWAELKPLLWRLVDEALTTSEEP